MGLISERQVFKDKNFQYSIEVEFQLYARLPDKQHLDERALVSHYVALSVALLLPYFNPQLREQVLAWVKKAMHK